MENRVKFDISTTTILKVIFAIFLVWFIYAVRDIVLLFFIVIVIVTALSPLVDRMSQHIPRILSLIILSVALLGGLVGVGFLIIPPIVNQISQLAINLPDLISHVGPLYETWQPRIANYQESLINLSSQLGGISSGIYSTTLGFIGGIIALFTILVLSFYMLLEQNAIKNFIGQTIPVEHKDKIIEIMHKIGDKMGKWLRGQFVLMVIIGILDGVALGVLGVPYALTLAVWGGITEVIPYVGPWLGLIPAAIIAFTVSPVKGLFILIAYVVIQQLEAQFLAPKIMGKAVGLSPIIIILSLLVGAKLMGILGVIVAVPAAAAIGVIIQEWPEIKKIRS